MTEKTDSWQQTIIYHEGNPLTEVLPVDWFSVFFTVKEGRFQNVYLKPLNEDHRGVFPDKQGIQIAFKRNLIEEDVKEYALEVLNLFNLTPDNQMKVNMPFQQPLQHILWLLKHELSPHEGHFIMVKSLLKILLLQLIKIQHDGFIQYDLNNQRVYTFLHLMENHYQSEPKVAYYAGRMGLSTKRLNQILKKKLDRTARQIIEQRQITESKRMLQSARYSVKEIAFQLGFQSITSFTRFFKRHTGIPPSAFTA